MKFQLVSAGALIIAAVFAVGVIEIQHVYAQVDSTSTDPAAESTPPTDAVETSPTPLVEGASTSTSEEPDATAQQDTVTTAPEEAAIAPADTSPSTETATESVETPPESAQAATSPNGLVEVRLQCTSSYTGTLYDTPSGHLEAGYFLGTESASTTGMTVAHEIGQQSWTVCHDARGNVHEFTLTPEEYAALSVRGTPQKSVMEPASEAALDSFE